MTGIIEEYTSRSVAIPVEAGLDKKGGSGNKTRTEANHCRGVSIVSGGEEGSVPQVTNHTEERQRRPQGSLVFGAMERRKVEAGRPFPGIYTVCTAGGSSGQFLSHSILLAPLIPQVPNARLTLGSVAFISCRNCLVVLAV